MTAMFEKTCVAQDWIVDVLGVCARDCDLADGETAMNYWLDILQGVVQSHCLPTDKVCQVKHRCDRTQISFTVDPIKQQAMKDWCTRHEVAPFHLLQSLFALLIGRYSNISDIVMGGKISIVEREQPLTSPSVSAKRFILRNNIVGNPGLVDFVSANQQITTAAYRHHQVDLAQLVRTLQIRQSDSDLPIYQLKFHYQLQLAETAEQLATINVVGNEYNHNTLGQLGLDLELTVMDLLDKMELHWFYNANLFNQSTVVQFNQSFNALLDAVLEDHERPVYMLPMMSQQQIAQVLDECQGESFEHAVSTIDQLFEAQVEKTPDNIAIRFDNQQMSYRELNQLANRLARAMEAQGVVSETLVGLCLERTPMLVAAVIAIFKLQAVYIPLDPSYPKSRLAFMLEDSKIPVVLTEKVQFEHLPTANVLTLQLDELLQLEVDNNNLDKSNGIDRRNSLSSTSTHAYVLYTSGSTGRPKGVIGTHGSLTNRLQWMQRCYPASEQTVFCVRTSVGFVDHIAELFQPLMCGASMALLTQQQAIDSALLAQKIDDYQINRLTLVPSLLQLLLEHKSAESLNSLALVLSSGEPLKFSVVEMFHQIYGKDAVLLNLYGSTEVGADVSCYESSNEQQNHILRYFDKESDEKTHDPDDVDNIFAQLHDLSSAAGEPGFTQPNVSLEQLLDKFKNTEIPERSMKLNQYLDLLREDVLPYIIDVSQQKYIGHMTSALPNFIPQFSRLIAKYNQNIVKIETSKSLTLIERQVLAMTHRLFYDLPVEHYENSIQDPMNLHGIITSGGSLANITSLFCARNKGLIAQGISPEVLRDQGANAVMNQLGYRDAVILVSRLAHYSIKKAAALLGIGVNGLIIIEQDENLRIKTEVLEQKIAQCRSEKRFIIAIIGIAGATETGTIDPLEDMADIAQKHAIHFHADAAWGGAFMFSDIYKHKLRGIERADSITFCAHKQLYLAQGISLCVFKDPKSIFAITTHADYQAAVGSFDLGQFTLEGSRPASSLQLHASLHLLAKDGYAWLIKRSMEKTAFFRQLLQSCEAFELVGDNDLNIINYRYIPAVLRNTEERYCEQYTDSQNEVINAAVDLIQKRQFSEGKTFVSQTKIVHKSFGDAKITVFRVVLSNPKTTPEDLFDVLQDQLRIASTYIEKQTNQLMLSTQAANIAIAQSGRYTTPIGKPIDAVKLYILDQYMNLVPNGVIGEVYIAGDCLSAGYLNHPELTEQCFMVNPFGPGRLYRSGDLARRMSDGNIEFTGRQDHQVKINGLRVELSEIELILNDSKLVRQAVVLARRDFLQHESLVAFIVVKEGVSDDDKQMAITKIRNNLLKRLPDYMIPASFKLLDAMPLTVNGKIDFKGLASI